MEDGPKNGGPTTQQKGRTNQQKKGSDHNWRTKQRSKIGRPTKVQRVKRRKEVVFSIKFPIQKRRLSSEMVIEKICKIKEDGVKLVKTSSKPSFVLPKCDQEGALAPKCDQATTKKSTGSHHHMVRPAFPPSVEVQPSFCSF